MHKSTFRVRIPKNTLEKWVDDESQVGFEENIELENGEFTNVLIEKDFKRLVRRSDKNENEKDMYKNPNSR